MFTSQPSKPWKAASSTSLAAKTRAESGEAKSDSHWRRFR
jgi:hypothetical protein